MVEERFKMPKEHRDRTANIAKELSARGWTISLVRPESHGNHFPSENYLKNWELKICR